MGIRGEQRDRRRGPEASRVIDDGNDDASVLSCKRRPSGHHSAGATWQQGGQGFDACLLHVRMPWPNTPLVYLGSAVREALLRAGVVSAGVAGLRGLVLGPRLRAARTRASADSFLDLTRLHNSARGPPPGSPLRNGITALRYGACCILHASRRHWCLHQWEPASMVHARD